MMSVPEVPAPNGVQSVIFGRDALKPANAVVGHLYYATDTAKLYYWNGSTWTSITFSNLATTLTVTIQTGASYEAQSTDALIVCNRASAMTVTLPAATGSGKEYRVKNINSGTVTVEGNSADTIDGELNQSLYQWEGIILVDYATGKWVVT